MKGLFIPEITAEMFRNGCLESIEALMAEGEIYDIDYSPWIPVSERLPEENGRYVVYINAKVHLIQIIPFAKNLHEISLDFTSKKAGWYDYDSEYGFFERTGIEAWMPLPEPYKAESEVKENG